MIGDDDRVRAEIDRAPGIVNGQNALEDELARPQ